MCNKLHEDFEPIKKSGFAWKIFGKYPGELIACFGGSYRSINDPRYRKSSKGWIVWDLEKGWFNDNSGFCAFRTRNEARRALGALLNPLKRRYRIIRKIQYKEGLGKHWEDRMIGGERYETIIIKKFKITEVRG